MSRETPLVKNGNGTWTVKDQVWKLPKRYELNKVLGAGAYGCVCRATDHEDEEEVAVKRIEDVFISKTDALRILREISILKRLRHANIVRLLNVINPVDAPAQIRTMYVMFEYGGMDLHKFEALDRYLTEDEIKTVMLQLCEGVKFMHRSCVIHRDLKPANILIDPDTLVVKIADFGLARVLDHDVAVIAFGLACVIDLDSDVVMGMVRDDVEDEEVMSTPDAPPPPLQRHMSEHVVTRWYRAPEVILGRGHYAQSIDNWSIGCIFAELLNLHKNVERRARRPLFPGRSCFPLTPTSNTCFKDTSDQLNTIFAVLGTPTKEEVAALDAGPDVKSYLGKQLSHKEPVDLKEKFPHAGDAAIELLIGLLKFLADERIDMAKKTELAVTEQALMELSMQNKHLAELRDGAADETMDEAPSKLSVRSESLLAAKELLSLNYEKKYDRRNHTEAVVKLSAMFHAEIARLHLLSGNEIYYTIGRNHTEAVAKLSAMFHTEIEGLHANPPSKN
ncbi:kinase-like domain-containing protein [Baffinella frigidus]|nr:kinase-like domain-containing protein [Cryptophyta sp. CCMP2293]